MNENELLDLLTQGEAELRPAFAEVVRYLREQNTLEDIERAVQENRIDDALAGIDAAAEKIAARIEQVYVQGALAEAKAVTATGSAGLVHFQVSNPSAVARMQASTFDKVKDFTDEQRKTARDAMVRGLGEGRNPKAIAREIRGSIGLTPKQEQIVDNYRRQLENGQWAQARARVLHDDRFNRAFEAAQRRAQGMTPLISEQQTERMVEAYRKSFLQLRAETFARTEASRAIHQGQNDLYEQAFDRGELRRSQLECTWHAGAPPRTRVWHSVMNRQTRPWGRPFHSGQGNILLYPGDPQAPGDEVCNCRCGRSVRIIA